MYWYNTASINKKVVQNLIHTIPSFKYADSGEFTQQVFKQYIFNQVKKNGKFSWATNAHNVLHELIPFCYFGPFYLIKADYFDVGMKIIIHR